MGRTPLPDDVVASYVGNGAPALIRGILPGANEEQIASALEYFLRYYRDHMLDATTLYPGVRQALDRLHAARVPLAILTNKPVRFSERLIEGLDLGAHFFRIYGGNSFEEKKPHPRGIEALMAESGAAPERTIMVGDSAVDVKTARAAGVVACGVTWGFQAETFSDAEPDFLITSMASLADRIL